MKCNCGSRARKARPSLRRVGDVESTPKVCKPIKWNFSTPRKNKIDVNGVILDDSGEPDTVIEGALELLPRRKLAQVSFIRSHGYPRCGYGTKLYEKFLEVACAKGFRLASDEMRSEHSESFWKKQVAKGRATCLSYKRPAHRLDPHSFDKIGFWSCRQYAISAPCPIDRSLAGVKRRRRR